MKSNKINLIIMNNEGKTHKFNISSAILCIIIGLLILIPIFFTLSIWLNIHLYNERNKAMQSQLELQYMVDQNAQTIVRLNNLESFLRDHSPGVLGLLVSQSQTNTSIIPTIEGKDEGLAKELSNSTKKDITNKPIQVATLDDQADNEENQSNANTDKVEKEEVKPTEQTQTNAKPEEPAQTEQQSETVAANNTKQEIPTEEIKQSINLGYVVLEQVQANLVAKNLIIQYHLKNSGKAIPLAGQQKYTLIDINNGKVERTPFTNVRDASFRIRNLKIVENTIILSGIKVGKMARIQIDIVRNDAILFSETYPINR